MSDNITWEEAVRWLMHTSSQVVVDACYFNDEPIIAAKKYSNSEEFNTIVEIIGKNIEGKKILDLGAGNGIASYAFANLGAYVTAVEPYKSDLVGSGAIKNLNKSLKNNISVVESYGESLPLENETFDLIYGRQVAHHAQDLDLFFNEAYRVLKPNGIMITARDHVVNNEEDLNQFLSKHLLHHKYGGEHAFRVLDYMNAAKNAGFKLDRQIGPLESIVNTFPESIDKIKLKIRSELRQQKSFISYILSRFMKPENVQKNYGKKASLSYYEPGMLVSFIFRKK